MIGAGRPGARTARGRQVRTTLWLPWHTTERLRFKELNRARALRFLKPLLRKASRDVPIRKGTK